MSETLYTYVRVRRPNGPDDYVRVPLDQAENYPGRVVEPLVAMPRVSPLYKNGEFQGGGSAALDSILAKTEAAAAQRALRDALEAQAEADRINARLGRGPKPEAPQAATRRFLRIVEP